MIRYLPLMFVLLLNGCSKDNEPDTEALLAQTWRLTARSIVSSVEGTPLEVFVRDRFVPGTCFSDMGWTFKPGGKFQHETAPSCMQPGEPDVTTYVGKWTLENNGKTLKIVPTGPGIRNMNFDIVSITSTELVIEQMERQSMAGDVYVDVRMQYRFMPR